MKLASTLVCMFSLSRWCELVLSLKLVLDIDVIVAVCLIFTPQADARRLYGSQRSRRNLLDSLREAHSDKDRWLGNAVMCITQDANGSRLHDHGQRKIHRILEPSFCESAEDVPMSDLQYVISKVRNTFCSQVAPTKHLLRHHLSSEALAAYLSVRSGDRGAL